MNEVYLVFALFLLLNVMAVMVRILRGPTPADRMLAAQLILAGYTSPVEV
jgi:multicomponent Na+:H+ antiporter subunit F